MSNESTITIVGNLTADPELRRTDSGTAVVGFDIASTPRFMRDGEWQDGETVFVRCNIWRDHAENLADSLKKGQRVIVFGSMSQSNWEGVNNEKRSRLEIDVIEMGPSLRFHTAEMTRVGGNSEASLPPRAPRNERESKPSANQNRNRQRSRV